jgi:hypothetical protein
MSNKYTPINAFPYTKYLDTCTNYIFLKFFLYIYIYISIIPRICYAAHVVCQVVADGWGSNILFEEGTHNFAFAINDVIPLPVSLLKLKSDTIPGARGPYCCCSANAAMAPSAKSGRKYNWWVPYWKRGITDTNRGTR